MSTEQEQIPMTVLDDLCSRFIINMPPEQRDDLVRVLFAVELAHWFYIDFYCEDDNDTYKYNIKGFAQQIFQHCPFLRIYVNNLDNIVSKWRDYKLSVPTYGAILIDPTYEHILLVQGFCSRESWGFPKGKVQENESPLKCAIREVMEEVGFDMKDRAFENQYLERDLNGQIIRLYVIKDVPLDTKFAPKTKNEIKEMRWFPIADLPCHRRDTTPQIKLNLSPKAFFMVLPFVKDLRRWITKQRGINSPSNGGDSDNTNENIKRHEQINLFENNYQNQPRRRTQTFHGYTRPLNIPKKSSFNYNDSTRKRSSKILANLTAQNLNDQQISSKHLLQKQLSVQDTIQGHFSRILKNDSITVTDQTSITENLLMRENTDHTLYITQLTPPMSNNDENKRPLSMLNLREKTFTDDLKSQENRHKHSNNVQEPLSNLTNETFRFSGPRCWTKFRLNRFEIVDYRRK